MVGRHLEREVDNKCYVPIIAKNLRTTYDTFKVFDRPVLLEEVIQTRDLYEPSHIVRVNFVVHHPSREFIPFIHISAINTDTPFTILIRFGELYPTGGSLNYHILT